MALADFFADSSKLARQGSSINIPLLTSSLGLVGR